MKFVLKSVCFGEGGFPAVGIASVLQLVTCSPHTCIFPAGSDMLQKEDRAARLLWDCRISWVTGKEQGSNSVRRKLDPLWKGIQLKGLLCKVVGKFYAA